jgi:hypothetical protein
MTTNTQREAAIDLNLETRAMLLDVHCMHCSPEGVCNSSCSVWCDLLTLARHTEKMERDIEEALNIEEAGGQS